MTTFAKQPFTFEQATKFISGKKDLPTSMTSKQYLLQLDEQTRRRSFFSARVASADLLAELHDKVQGVVDGSMTDAQARELLRMFLADDGKDLLASLGFSPPSADGGLAELGSVRRLQLIIDTNTRMAQEIGAFKEWQEMADLVPYGVWHLGVSEEHRHVHVAHDGKLFRYDHPIWRLDPPGGLFNCHCWREELTEDEAKARGLIPEPSNSPVTPSPLGFDPGKDLDGMFPIKPGMPPEIRNELDAILKKTPPKRAPRKTSPPVVPATTVQPQSVVTAAAARVAIKEKLATAGLSLDAEIDRIPDAVLNTVKATPNIISTRANKAFCTGDTLTLCKDKAKWAGDDTVFPHEYGHFIHNELHIINTTTGITSAEFKTAMHTDWEAWRDNPANKQALKVMNKVMIDQAMKQHLAGIKVGDDSLHWKKQSLDIQHRALGFADTIGGMSRGVFGAGHKDGYYRRANGTFGDAEVFANVYRAITMGWNEYETAFPLTSALIRSKLSL